MQSPIYRQVLWRLFRTVRAPDCHLYGVLPRHVFLFRIDVSLTLRSLLGGSLDSIYKQIRARGGRTGEKILGKVAEAVLNGLVYLHDRKIIHRGELLRDSLLFPDEN